MIDVVLMLLSFGAFGVPIGLSLFAGKLLEQRRAAREKPAPDVRESHYTHVHVLDKQSADHLVAALTKLLAFHADHLHNLQVQREATPPAPAQKFATPPEPEERLAATMRQTIERGADELQRQLPTLPRSAALKQAAEMISLAYSSGV